MTQEKKEAKTQTTNKKQEGGFYERKPIEEIRTFKSKDGKFFVVQVIKTCVFPINYIRAIVEFESPYKTEVSKGKVSGGKK